MIFFSFSLARATRFYVLHLSLKLMFVIFSFQQKVSSSGFSWPADQGSEHHSTTSKSNNNSEKDKIKKLDFESKTSPKTPLNQQDSNFSVSSGSATNLETMPVPGAQGQNPTQGQDCCESLIMPT